MIDRSTRSWCDSWLHLHVHAETRSAVRTIEMNAIRRPFLANHLPLKMAFAFAVSAFAEVVGFKNQGHLLKPPLFLMLCPQAGRPYSSGNHGSQADAGRYSVPSDVATELGTQKLGQLDVPLSHGDLNKP